MTRLVPFVALASLAPLLAAPVPKGKAKPDYYPLGLGATWEYVRNQDADNVWHEEVTKADDRDGGRVATVRITPGTPNATAYDTSYRADKDGWYFVTQGSVSYDPPAKFISADPKAGDTWELNYKLNGTEYAATATVGEAEEVTVPAGTYTAVPVTVTFGKPAQRRAYTNWIVPGVGMVKQVAGGRVTQELKSYTPGK
jgi:hypothetical protein